MLPTLLRDRRAPTNEPIAPAPTMQTFIRAPCPYALTHPRHHVLGEHPEDLLALLEALSRHLRENGDPVDAPDARDALHLCPDLFRRASQGHEVHEAVGHERAVARVGRGVLKGIVGCPEPLDRRLIFWRQFYRKRMAQGRGHAPANMVARLGGIVGSVLTVRVSVQRCGRSARLRAPPRPLPSWCAPAAGLSGIAPVGGGPGR